MRALLFQGFVDPLGRAPEALLEAWPTLTGVAEALVAAGIEVDVLAAARQDELIESAGARYRFVREPRLPAPRRLLGHRATPHPLRTLRAAARYAVDVVHVHGLSFPLQVRGLRRRQPRSVLVAQDHADRPPPGWRRAVHRWGFSGLDGVVFTARELAEPFVHASIIRADVPVFEVIEGSTRFTPGPSERRPRPAGAGAGTWAVWVGNLEPTKDPATLLDALSIALREDLDVRVGMAFRRGSLEEAVRRRVSEDHLLSSRVQLLGAVEHAEMESLMRGADLLVSTSRREGSGYSVIEALACGTPVVISDIPAHRSLVGDGDCGVLVPPGHPRALATALTRTAARANSLRGAARSRFEAVLSFPAIGRALADAYDALLSGRGAEGVPG